jgi:hypothetical protein
MKIHLSTLVLTAAGLLTAAQAGTVSSTANSGAGSLREVLAAAAPGEVINFAPALEGATITLTSGELALSGRNVTLDASALRGGVTLSGNNSTRILSITAGSNVTLKNLRFVAGREAANKGGGLLVAESALAMQDCTIQDCHAGTDGGGIWLNSATGSLTRCKIVGNESGNFGGGLFIIGNTPLSLTSSQVTGNKSAIGGGIYVLSASPQITNTTIQGNSGSGMATQTFAAPTLRNCILWANRGGGGSTVASQQLRNISVFNPSLNTDPAPNVGFCLVEGANSAADFSDNNLTTWSSGNLNGSTSQPAFIHSPAATAAPTTAANVRLRATSAASNAGSNAATSDLSDLTSRPRVQGGTVDLGAFEGAYVSFSLLHPDLNPDGDANSNGLSNFAEYALGRDPAAATSSTGMPSISLSAGAPFLTLSERNNAADVLPRWRTSIDLSTWTDMLENTDYQIESTSTPATGRTEYVIKLIGPKRFYQQRHSSGN